MPTPWRPQRARRQSGGVGRGRRRTFERCNGVVLAWDGVGWRGMPCCCRAAAVPLPCCCRAARRGPVWRGHGAMQLRPCPFDITYRGPVRVRATRIKSSQAHPSPAQPTIPIQHHIISSDPPRTSSDPTSHNRRSSTCRPCATTASGRRMFAHFVKSSRGANLALARTPRPSP